MTTFSTNTPHGDQEVLADDRDASNRFACQVLEILDRGSYQAASGITVSVKDAQLESQLGTELYTPQDLQALSSPDNQGSGGPLQIEVIDATTQVAAESLQQEGPVVLLNFASARNPGGGFLGGARAQEEDLCRCSGLYRTLLTQPTYYLVHRDERSLLYTDHLIYSPAVPFFRTAANAPLLDAPFLASVITAPAPNAAALRRSQPKAMGELGETFLRRWTNILAVAQENGHKILVLGAWGCGAFRNDPKLVASAAREALLSPRFSGAFSRIVFPIPGFNKYSQENLDVFSATLC